MNAPINEMQIICIQDVQDTLKIGRTAAAKIYKDIKQEYGLSKVLFCHLTKYFKC